MKVCRILLTLALVSLAVAGAIPKKDKTRIVDKELSDEEHFDGEEEHNPEYDHEAFLGKDEAKEFDDLTPEESKERLGKIYDKIDTDHDGKVGDVELKAWIKLVQNKYVEEDTERQWKEHDLNSDGQLTWMKYKKRTYGSLEKDYVDRLLERADPDWEPGDTDEDEAQYADMIKRDQRRWKEADQDHDEVLTKKEFADFLHPEEAEHMKKIVVEETLEDIDKNGDRLISEEEYIGDFYPDEDDEPEPEWVAHERKSFREQHDTNKDGKLDEKEISTWIMPDDYDHTEAESKHLVKEADADKDGFLTKEEVLNKYDLFVGSQATDFGEALTRHDEF